MTLVFSQSMNLSGSTCPGRLQETLMHGLSQMAPCLSGFGKSSYFGIVETGRCASSSCGWLSGKGRGEPSPPSSTVSHTRQHTLSTTQLAAGFTRSPEGGGGLPLPLPSQNLRPLSSSQVRSRTHARPELPQYPDPFPVKSLPEVSVRKSDCYCCRAPVKTETFLSSQAHTQGKLLLTLGVG